MSADDKQIKIDLPVSNGMWHALQNLVEHCLTEEEYFRGMQEEAGIGPERADAFRMLADKLDAAAQQALAQLKKSG